MSNTRSLIMFFAAAILAACWIGMPTYVAAGDKAKPTADDTLFANLQSVPDNKLEQLRGRDDNTKITVQSIQQLDAQVSNSSFQADQINTGAVTFSESALQGFAGVGMFTIVTGNNNAVDAGLGITFNLH